MRRHDKKEHMKKVNLLFEQRCNENAFSWDGKYANEEDLTEDDKNDYQFPYNQEGGENDKDLFDSESLDEGCELTMGNDLECECEGKTKDSITEFETTDVEASEFFSDVDAKRLQDGPPVG